MDLNLALHSLEERQQLQHYMFSGHSCSPKMTTYVADAYSVGDSIGPFYQLNPERQKVLLPLNAICNAAEFLFEKFLILAVLVELWTL